MLRVGKEIYVASLVSIIETVQSKGEDLSCVAGVRSSQAPFDYLPVIRLYDLFGIDPTAVISPTDCSSCSRLRASSGYAGR